VNTITMNRYSHCCECHGILAGPVVDRVVPDPNNATPNAPAVSMGLMCSSCAEKFNAGTLKSRFTGKVGTP